MEMNNIARKMAFIGVKENDQQSDGQAPTPPPPPSPSKPPLDTLHPDAVYDSSSDRSGVRLTPVCESGSDMEMANNTEEEEMDGDDCDTDNEAGGKTVQYSINNGLFTPSESEIACKYG